MITIDVLKKHFRYAKETTLSPILTIANGPKDKLIKAHFLAQLAHESDAFKTLQEYASGSAYEGRKDLGNTNPGDGVKFKGRGYIQLTGRANYEKASQALGLDLVHNPNDVLIPSIAMKVAQWYWDTHSLDALALKDDLSGITKKINGGHNGLLSRGQYLRLFKAIL